MRGLFCKRCVCLNCFIGLMMQRNPTLLVNREVFNLFVPVRIHEKRWVTLRLYYELHGSAFGTVIAV